jgi:hypothetical protein
LTNEHRIQELEHEVKALQKDAAVIPVLAEQIAGIRADIALIRESHNDAIVQFRETNKEFREEEKATRRWLVGFCGSVALACIVALIGVLQIGPP